MPGEQDLFNMGFKRGFGGDFGHGSVRGVLAHINLARDGGGDEGGAAFL
jgi:hypothetical protein